MGQWYNAPRPLHLMIVVCCCHELNFLHSTHLNTLATLLSSVNTCGSLCSLWLATVLLCVYTCCKLAWAVLCMHWATYVVVCSVPPAPEVGSEHKTHEPQTVPHKVSEPVLGSITSHYIMFRAGEYTSVWGYSCE